MNLFYKRFELLLTIATNNSIDSIDPIAFYGNNTIDTNIVQ